MRPVAFRVFDFKSIEDSGICCLSGDEITVLAGQNEAGKTAVLTALRDFDRELGAAPLTQDYEPEERSNANPRVSVEFADVDVDHILSELTEDNFFISSEAIEHLRHNRIWITRHFGSGQFSFDESVIALWQASVPSDVVSAPAPVVAAVEETEPKIPRKVMAANEFAGWLRDYWPAFVYFEAFQDSLPRQADFSDVKASVEDSKTSNLAAPGTPAPKVSSSVLDFVSMADLDIDRIGALENNDKTLGNYLSHCGAAITGDFLTYWKQKVDKEETVDLRVRHLRDATGKLKLAFYVHDKSDQYPDQRSKGFLWFLSFYLKLAAAQKRYPERRRILLIDEPGSYLHARAQRDVLHLLESRIAMKDQVVSSTHSPYLIPPDRLHRLRIVLKKTTSGTKVLDRLTHPDLRDAEFADSLSPVISAIGIDISQSITFSRQKNLFVEGISDYMYLTAWASITTLSS
jgi:AAA ATPase domain